MHYEWSKCQEIIFNTNARFVDERKLTELMKVFSDNANSVMGKSPSDFMPKEMYEIVISPVLNFASFESYFKQHKELHPYIETLRKMKHIVEESDKLNSKVIKKLTEYKKEIETAYNNLNAAIEFLTGNELKNKRNIQ